ncbi:hypothetical protein FHU41_002629 [Psychromicrobium silvestre]|uniref:Uncharacterized protein n=1 Tax=Psychromicrobium silvestre TaxID=1645614 RepID=A0A7Y9S7Z1_9MICC|nr:hypothetical protein [Psychromicrobium silvestre]NYE96379.1 hypothetical protein [Psychromicrobium silvestre]
MVDTLIIRWRTESLQRGWRMPTDWHVPEVELIVELLTAEQPLTEAAYALGSARAFYGVGIAESLSDLRVVFDVAGLPIDPDSLQGLAQGWVEANESLAVPSCVDAGTGLSSISHFDSVVRDLNLSDRAEGEQLCLASIRVRGIDDVPSNWFLLAQLGELCMDYFEERTMVYRRHSIDFLLPDQASYRLLLGLCRSELAALGDGVLEPSEPEYRSLRNELDRSVAHRI